MRKVQSRKEIEDDYDEEEENEKMHTGDLIFFCKKTSDSIASESKKYAQREKIGSETYYEVPISEEKIKTKLNARDVENSTVSPVAVYTFVQFRSAFIEETLKPFLMAWMTSNEAQYELTGDVTNDAIVAHVYLRKRFKKELCKEVKNASDIEDKPPVTFVRSKENRCSYVWGLPLSKNACEIVSNRIDDDDGDETNDLMREKHRLETSNEFESYCFLGPGPGDGCRKLLGFDPNFYEASSFDLKTRKLYHHSKQSNRSKKTSKSRSGPSLASVVAIDSIATKTCSTSTAHTTTTATIAATVTTTPTATAAATDTTATTATAAATDTIATTTTTATTTTAATIAATSVELFTTRQKTQNAGSNRNARGGNSKRSFGSGSSRDKTSLSFDSVLKRMHIYHAIICEFMLDRVYESNYKEKYKKMYEASQNWLPSWCLCCCLCDFGSSIDFEDDDEKMAVRYDRVANFKEDENDRETEYKKIYNSRIHGPWSTDESIDSVFNSKSIHSTLAYFDTLFVCSSLMTVYSDIDPRNACWNVSEKVERASEIGTTNLVTLSSNTATDAQFPHKNEGTSNAGSREPTPRSDSDDKRENAREPFFSSSSSDLAYKKSLAIVPNENDLKIEMTEALPFTCMTSGRRVGIDDVAKTLRTAVTIYHQKSAKSGIRNTKDMVYFSKANGRELGTEFSISDLKECTF
jgi:hypothetical protein